MVKVICEKCGTEFKFEIAKDFECCPVCGEAFESISSNNEEMDNTSTNNTVQDDGTEEGLMYFDEIATLYKERPEFNGVYAYCKECGKINSLELDKFDELVDKNHVELKENVIVICKGCGKEHKPRKIMYKRKDHYAPPLPRCPVCNSVMLKKITKGSKSIAAATVGMFALPYNSKTFECKDCGYRF